VSTKTLYKLFDCADVIRSKNSGPYELTFDIIFKEQDIFEKFANLNIMTKTVFAQLYNIDADDVISVIAFSQAKAIKITTTRPIASGDLGETDVYGAQQHAPLLGFQFEM